MTKERAQRLVVGLVVVLLASALGYLLVPSAMLSIVGIDSNPQVNFLVPNHRRRPVSGWRWLALGTGCAPRS